jgi:uncharacterized protein YndB with AHSA1/START domain
MYTVVAQRQVPASVETVWNHLSKPELLSKWFADTAYIGPEAPLYMETGDGDFFSGRVIEWDPGIVLGVRWKFMGSGPEYEVRFSLLRRKQGTEVTVQDRGAVTVEEAECLRVGWSEFLMRFEKSILKNINTRFNWRKALNITIRVANAKRDQLASALNDPHWYQASLAGVRAQIHERRGNEIAATINHDAWGAAETRVRFKFKNIRGIDYAYVAHEGWLDLPADLAQAERKRFAAIWVNALAEFSVDRMCSFELVAAD